jgi:hypothetical protein
VAYPLLQLGVLSLCRRFLNQFDTWVIVRPVILASVFFSSGVGYRLTWRNVDLRMGRPGVNVMITIFGDFSLKMAVFFKKQCYDPIFAKTGITFIF